MQHSLAGSPVWLGTPACSLAHCFWPLSWGGSLPPAACRPLAVLFSPVISWFGRLVKPCLPPEAPLGLPAPPRPAPRRPRRRSGRARRSSRSSAAPAPQPRRGRPSARRRQRPAAARTRRMTSRSGSRPSGSGRRRQPRRRRPKRRQKVGAAAPAAVGSHVRGHGVVPVWGHRVAAARLLRGCAAAATTRPHPLACPRRRLPLHSGCPPASVLPALRRG